MTHYEDAEQQALFQWAQLQPCAGGKIGTFLVHVPNGGFRKPQEAARLKALGVTPGVSDLLFTLPRLGYHGLWIEMKRQLRHFRTPTEAKAAVSDEQHDWLKRMTLNGYAGAVCYGADEAMRLLSGYSAGNRQEFHRVYDVLLHRFYKAGAA